MTRRTHRFAVALLVASTLSVAGGRAQVPYRPSSTITVGVRADAPPFSYRRVGDPDRETLGDYGGYIVEICREVLRDMIVSGPFAGFAVEEHEVTAGSRWPKLESGRVDMLCGPDSITLDRLERYNASHPLFLSGITFISVDDSRFPRGVHCQAVIGLLENTTAETEGLRAIAKRDDLGGFDEALEVYLALAAESARADGAGELHAHFTSFEETLRTGEGSSSERIVPGRKEKISPADVKTERCPNGFQTGPVVFYDSHERGIRDLCDGNLLYYVADVDILARRAEGCDVIMHRETFTREAYGVFFRRDRTPLGSSVAGARAFPDSVLYAEFNNVLLRKMQRKENILDYEFRQEFKGEQPTEDLQRFFEGYKFASDF